jgi:hypothetical protein
MDDDLMVEKTAQQDTVLGAGLAAVLLVLDVVHVAGGGRLVAAAGEPAVPVAQGHRVADARRDGLGVPNVQRQARAAQPGAQLPAPQERREPARAGQQVHGLADNRLLESGPGLGGVRPGLAVAAEPVQLDGQPDQVLQGRLC